MMSWCTENPQQQFLFCRSRGHLYELKLLDYILLLKIVLTITFNRRFINIALLGLDMSLNGGHKNFNNYKISKYTYNLFISKIYISLIETKTEAEYG